jgi:phage shock protein A
MFQLIPPTIVQVELLRKGERELEQVLEREQKLEVELEPEQDDDGDLERKTRKSVEWNPPGSG